MLGRSRRLIPNFMRLVVMQSRANMDSSIAMFSTDVQKKRRCEQLQSFFPSGTGYLSDVCNNFHSYLSASESDRGAPDSVEVNNIFVAFVVDVMRDVAYQLWGLHRAKKTFGSFSHDDVFISKSVDVGDVQDIRLVSRGIPWKDPIQFLEREYTYKTDMFYFGCVLYFCLSGGVHPFGDASEFASNSRDIRIDFSPIKHIPEAEHLISLLLSPKPELRPSAKRVLRHPLFMCIVAKHSFLIHVISEVNSGRAPNFAKTLKNELPILADKNWSIMYNHLHLGAFSGNMLRRLDQQSLWGPCWYNGFVAETVLKLFKIMSAVDVKGEEMKFQLRRLRRISYDRYCPRSNSYFPFSESESD